MRTSRLIRTTVALIATAAAAASSSCALWGPPPFPAASASVAGQVLSREAAVADVETLVRVLEEVHPDLYAARSRDSTNRERERLLGSLPPSMTRADFWVRLAPFVAGFGDGHTNVLLPGDEIARMQKAGALVFPPSVALDEADRLVVSVPFGSGTQLGRGDRVVSVNGLSADSMVHAWVGEFSGESLRFRLSLVTNNFRSLQLVHGIHAPYALEIESAAGGMRKVIIPGIPQDSLRRLVSTNQARASVAANFTYRVLAPRAGYMNLRTLAGPLPKFATDLSIMFRQVAADSDRVLIIDLRENGGGDSRFGDELLRYITTAPYRMSARKDWKMSAEYRSYLKSFVRPPLRWLRPWNFSSTGRSLMRGPNGTIVPLPEEPSAHSSQQPFFAGAVCLLIGPHTFSSAVDLADAMKTYHLATLIGEETGGRPNGFGEIYPFRLPRSQLAVSVSSARFVRASGDLSDTRGVMPDIEVKPSRADVQAGRDVVLERARDCR